jgi:hypothetical protein
MAWDEAKAWLSGTLNGNLYQNLLDDALARPARSARRKKIIHPEDMPWEMARQGLLKHLLNEQMHTRMETVDAYMQVIPPGSRSGKHRHLAEECLYVVEGHGYDLHQDCDVGIVDTYRWQPQSEIKRFEWEAGDVMLERSRADRGCAGIRSQCRADGRAGEGLSHRKGRRPGVRRTERRRCTLRLDQP